MKKFIILIICALLCGYLIAKLFTSKSKIPYKKMKAELVQRKEVVNPRVNFPKTTMKNKMSLEDKTTLIEKDRELKDINKMNPCDAQKYLSKLDETEVQSYLNNEWYGFYFKIKNQGFKVTTIRQEHEIDGFLDDLEEVPSIWRFDLLTNIEHYITGSKKLKERIKGKVRTKLEYYMHNSGPETLGLSTRYLMENHHKSSLIIQKIISKMNGDKKYKSLSKEMAVTLMHKAQTPSEIAIALVLINRYRQSLLRPLVTLLWKNEKHTELVSALNKLGKQIIDSEVNEKSNLYRNQYSYDSAVHMLESDEDKRKMPEMGDIYRKNSKTTDLGSCDDRELIDLCDKYCIKN